MDNRDILKDSIKEGIRDSRDVLFRNTRQDEIYKAVALKTERLVSAIHLVTGLMDIKDNVRWELRSAAVDSIGDLYMQTRTSPMVKGFVSEKILERISHILALLEVGFTGGLISKMNYTILKEEYIKLRDVVSQVKLTDGVRSFVLPENFFGEDLVDLEMSNASSIRDIRDTIKSIGHKNASAERIKKDTTGTQKTAIKTVRQSLILEAIKDGLEYTIKDIISAVLLLDKNVDCSDKTIQRDLLALVASGVLNKSGERRWSRYSKK